MIETLLAALRAEFEETDVSFYAVPPSQPIAPSVVVYPANPFLDSNSGYITEHWSIRVVASAKDVGTSVDQMRRNSLKIRRAINEAGGGWGGAGGPVGITDEANQNVQFVFSENDCWFRYAATEITDPEDS